MEEKEGIIKEINKIFKRGKIVGRGKESYTYLSALSVNCFAHAFFNFTNADIKKLTANYAKELERFLWDYRGFLLSPKDAFVMVSKDFLKRVKEAGLIMEECDKEEQVSKGQWKVAYYFNFDDVDLDFHFLRQEKNGKWSSKFSLEKEIEYFDELPERYRGNYKLIKIYKVTNPYIAKNKYYTEEEIDNYI